MTAITIHSNKIVSGRRSNGREAGQGCFGSLKIQRKGGLRGRFRGLAQDKLLLPVAPPGASLMRTLRVQEMQPEREGRERERCGHVPQREGTYWVLCLEGFSLSCRQES